MSISVNAYIETLTHICLFDCRRLHAQKDTKILND